MVVVAGVPAGAPLVTCTQTLASLPRLTMSDSSLTPFGHFGSAAVCSVFISGAVPVNITEPVIEPPAPPAAGAAGAAAAEPEPAAGAAAGGVAGGVAAGGAAGG